MTIAILDPAAGISGDMTLGALIDLGAPREWLEGLPARLGFPNVEVTIAQVERASLRATQVRFEIAEGQPHGRHLGELIEMVERAPLSPRVRDRAVRAFRLVGEAEGRVHGCAPEQVHLHEVGAIDAVLDIVGAIEGFEQLGIEAVYHLPVALGTGWVEAAHGQLPVPAPAVGLLLEGIEVVRGGPVEGEATTPTGAALIRALSAGPPPAQWRLVGTGWGAGERNPRGYPNALRVMVAETAHEAGTVDVVITDIDDLSPEYVEPLRQALFDAGAVECVTWPAHGKKGRVTTHVEVVAPPERAAAVRDALFRHSSTAGIRYGTFLRHTLPRREFTVELDGGVRVRIKAWNGPAGCRWKAEFDDVVAAAARLGQPARDVARDADRRAEAMLATVDWSADE